MLAVLCSSFKRFEYLKRLNQTAQNKHYVLRGHYTFVFVMSYHEQTYHGNHVNICGGYTINDN
jgi:hypothetical protein